MEYASPRTRRLLQDYSSQHSQVQFPAASYQSFSWFASA